MTLCGLEPKPEETLKLPLLPTWDAISLGTGLSQPPGGAMWTEPRYHSWQPVKWQVWIRPSWPIRPVQATRPVQPHKWVQVKSAEYPAELSPDHPPTELWGAKQKQKCCCLKPLSLGFICHAEIDRWYHKWNPELYKKDNPSWQSWIYPENTKVLQ